MQEKLFMTKGKIIIKSEERETVEGVGGGRGGGLGIGTKRPLKR